MSLLRVIRYTRNIIILEFKQQITTCNICLTNTLSEIVCYAKHKFVLKPDLNLYVYLIRSLAELSMKHLLIRREKLKQIKTHILFLIVDAFLYFLFSSVARKF